MHDSALPLIACEHSLTLPAGAVIAIARANMHAESYHRMALALEFAVNDIGMEFFVALATKEVVEGRHVGRSDHDFERQVARHFARRWRRVMVGFKLRARLDSRDTS